MVPAAPAAARTVATSDVQASADFKDDFDDRASGGLTCRAVLRSAPDTRGARVLTTASETAGATVDVV